MLFFMKTLLILNDTCKAAMFHAFFATEALPCTSNKVPNTLSNTSYIFHRRTLSSSERHLSAGINFELQNVANFVS
jgi:hypothetical protein